MAPELAIHLWARETLGLQKLYRFGIIVHHLNNNFTIIIAIIDNVSNPTKLLMQHGVFRVHCQHLGRVLVALERGRGIQGGCGAPQHGQKT